MCDKDWIKTHSAVCTAFENGSVTEVSDDILQTWLRNLSTGNTVNETIRYREIIRALTINHIQMKRHIDHLNAQSNKTQKWVMVLAIASLIGTLAQVYYADKSEKRSEAQERRTAIEQQKQKTK